MEGIPKQTAENDAENDAKNAPNFHEISEKRKELRKAIGELGDNSVIFEKHYKKPVEEVKSEASRFKIADFKDKKDPDEKDMGLKGAKEALRKQKSEYEKEVLENGADIDYETILKNTPELGKVQKTLENIADLKDFRMRRMFEILNSQTSLPARKRNEAVLKTIKEEIRDNEEKLEQANPLILRQAKLVEYKENLAQSGHICITPSAEKYLEAIGDRMLTGKPVFLHGPTGTGKTSLAKPVKGGGGAIETVDIYGPLAKAMLEGKTVIFDEFTALPKEQMVFIKGVFNAKAGDRINIVGNGIVEIKSGFQMIFTSNLKSEKNPERQDLPPEIAREFEQNNLEVRYTPSDEAYDIMLSRLLNRDGSLDMSFYDLNSTLPDLCKVMAEIQESYTNETDKEVARRAGAMDASGKAYSLKKFVMTQGSVEAILSSWIVERQTEKQERSFSEFLDERFKTSLTFKEYPKEDRILAAKILASKGFLLTLTAKDLDLPEDIFKLNTIKSMRGEDAAEELKEKSGAIKHLNLKEVAELDPFGKRAELLKSLAEGLLGEENKKDSFLNNLNKKMSKFFGKEKKNKNSEIRAEYTRPDGKVETLTLDLEAKLQDFLSFYQTTKVDLPPDFEDAIRDIWERNQTEMEQAIEQNGFDDMLIIPGNIPLADLAEKMKMESGYYFYQIKKDFSDVKSQNTDKPRIILFHHSDSLPEIAEKTGLDIHLNITGAEALKLYEANPLNYLATLEDAIVLERKYFEDTGKHMSDYKKKSTQWLPGSGAGARLVHSCCDPGARKLAVHANDLATQHGHLGVRPSRCFF